MLCNNRWRGYCFHHNNSLYRYIRPLYWSTDLVDTLCPGDTGVVGFQGEKGVQGPPGRTGATGATRLQVIHAINRRVKRVADGCPGELLQFTSRTYY